MICSASSRVGASTSATGRFGRASVRRATSGSPNPRVLPDPVGARPATSRPASASGITAAWMGNELLALALQAMEDPVGQAEIAERNRCSSFGVIGGKDARGVVDDGHFGDSNSM